MTISQCSTRQMAVAARATIYVLCVYNQCCFRLTVLSYIAEVDNMKWPWQIFECGFKLMNFYSTCPQIQ
jgi:hypothetical protein